MESKTSPNVNVKVDVDVDRISALRQVILHHILSFLPCEHVVQTSILSKTWKHVCHSCLI